MGLRDSIDMARWRAKLAVRRVANRVRFRAGAPRRGFIRVCASMEYAALHLGGGNLASVGDEQRINDLELAELLRTHPELFFMLGGVGVMAMLFAGGIYVRETNHAKAA